jgi:hypothetical protein
VNRSLVVVLGVGGLAACHPYVTGGYELTTKVTGPLAAMVTQPIASARSGTAADTAPIDPATTTPHTYSFAIGTAPARDFHVELGLHAHDVSSASFAHDPSSAAYLASPRYLTGTTSLDFAWTFLRTRHVGLYMHVGPAAGAVIDKSDGTTAYGQAVRFGGGLAIDAGFLRVFVDASQTDLMLTTGAAMGVNQLSGITVGLGLH